MNTRVEVVNLGREVYEVILTSVEVQSDQGKRTFMDRSVKPHVHSVHEAHVGIEQECFRGTQGARLFELRATVSLARLLRDSDQGDEGRTMLAEIYNWFTEGFDTTDLKEAKALLDQLRI
jgi:predicted ATPase